MHLFHHFSTALFSSSSIGSWSCYQSAAGMMRQKCFEFSNVFRMSKGNTKKYGITSHPGVGADLKSSIPLEKCDFFFPFIMYFFPFAHPNSCSGWEKRCLAHPSLQPVTPATAQPSNQGAATIVCYYSHQTVALLFQPAPSAYRSISERGAPPRCGQVRL